MASLYGTYHTEAFQNDPVDNVAAKVFGGKIRQIYDEINLSAVLAVGDKVYLGKLPKGAKVVEAILSFPDLGTTGVVDLGYEKVDSSLTSDQDAFLASVDVNSAADTVKMSDQNNMVGFGLEMDGDAYIVLKATTATTATSGKIRCCVQYVLNN